MANNFYDDDDDQTVAAGSELLADIQQAVRARQLDGTHYQPDAPTAFDGAPVPLSNPQAGRVAPPSPPAPIPVGDNRAGSVSGWDDVDGDGDDPTLRGDGFVVPPPRHPNATEPGSALRHSPLVTAMEPEPMTSRGPINAPIPPAPVPNTPPPVAPIGPPGSQPSQPAGEIWRPDGRAKTRRDALGAAPKAATKRRRLPVWALPAGVGTVIAVVLAAFIFLRPTASDDDVDPSSTIPAVTGSPAGADGGSGPGEGSGQETDGGS